MTNTSSAPGEKWRAVIARPGLEDFATAFSDTPELHASVLPRPLLGTAVIRGFFAATRAMYDRIAFTAETAAGAMIFLEWEGSYRQAAISGVTILDHDPRGRIVGIRLFHEPYDQITAFAADLAARRASTGERL